MFRIRNRRGLTLPEVLVTLAIVAVIAAVLVPALTSQISKGDAGRVSEDLKAVQTGINAFSADVRRYPASINQLANVISSTSDADLVAGTSYTSDHVSSWRGPYFVRDVPASADSLRTGFRGNIRADFLKRPLNSVDHVVVHLKGFTENEITAIDRLLDDGVSSTGLLRNSGTVEALYFAAVIQ
ncbi:MAG TPA: type II secretion system protein [Gemmatimonadaceae bacterium]|nr:type II secretion system protein [Gemmatimonadaceae bacterium]